MRRWRAVGARAEDQREGAKARAHAFMRARVCACVHPPPPYSPGLVAPTLSMFSRMLKLGSLPLPLALPPSLLLPPKGRATPRAA